MEKHNRDPGPSIVVRESNAIDLSLHGSPGDFRSIACRPGQERVAPDEKGRIEFRLSRICMNKDLEASPDLFDAPERAHLVDAPLAERMRPQSFDDLVGQEDIVGKDRPLRIAIEADRLSAVILWGPPACEKLTRARLISLYTNVHFVSFSAVTSGVPELREVIKGADHRLTIRGQKTILFVDEIHRFNKAQQDAFLPHVEKGTVILVGATTENPSFEGVAPLLSRSLVAVLKPLDEEALEQILHRALNDVDRGLGAKKIVLAEDARRRLIGFANGDARSLLMALEFVCEQAVLQPDGTRRLDDATMEAA